MKNGQIFTLGALLLMLAAVGAGASGYLWLGIGLGMAGFLLHIPGLIKHTGTLQFATHYLGLLVLSVLSFLSLFLMLPAVLPLVGAIFLAGTAGVMRVQFFSFFGHSRFLQLEAAIMALAVGLYVLANTLLGWQMLPAILLPIPPLLHGLVFAFMTWFEGLQLRKAAAKGYNAEIGKPAPGFELADQDGKMTRLEDFRGKRHLLVIFVRGDWCPHCHMMLRTYQKHAARFAEKNILVMAIGPDPVGVNRGMVEKLGLDYKVLSDDHLATARLYGIRIDDYKNGFMSEYEGGGVAPLPASFLIDKDGIVRYTSRPDRVGEFLNPDTIFPVVDQLERAA